MSDEEEVVNTEEINVYTEAYRRLPAKPGGTVRFFDRGNDEKVLVYDEDARLAARIIFKTNSAIRTFGSDDDKQYRAEIYETESSQKEKIRWILKYKGSPGNLLELEDILFSSNSEMTVNIGVIGVKIETKQKSKFVGVCSVNTHETIINLIQFMDNDSLTNFESVLVQLAPKEAVIPANLQSGDALMLVKILERNNVIVNTTKASDFDSENISQDIEKLLKNGEKAKAAFSTEMEKELAVEGLCGVIKYLSLMSGDTFLNQFCIKPWDFGLFVKMDASTCKALHLLNEANISSSSPAMNLISVIDKCRTAQGHRMLAQMIRQPLIDKNKIEERLDMVEILLDDMMLRQRLHENHLRRIPDCQQIAKKLMRKKGSLQDCYRGFLAISQLSYLIDCLEENESEKKYILEANFTIPLQTIRTETLKYKEMIETTLDLDLAERGDFVVKSTFDPSLQELRESMDELEEDMAEETYRMAKKLGLEAHKTLKLESNNQLGFVFRVTLRDEKSLRSLDSVEILGSTKQGATFRTHKLRKLSESFREKRDRYEDEQKQVVGELMDVAVGYSSSFEEIGNIAALLDVMTSFAVSAATSASTYVRPTILNKGEGKISFTKLRHPIMECQPSISYIPNDVHFSKGDHSFLIITGPNMGGKSTMLRSVGIACLLAQIGCYVPAEDAKISIVDSVLARVGAGDSLNKGVSTFMAEMIETSFILKTATADSMVLIDELGRGTATYDGFGLCWAISEHLVKKIDCFCIMATHFHELTELEKENPCVVNYHVSALVTDDGLTMLYKIQKGPCDRSFGIHVAELTGFPPEVLEVAREMISKLENCTLNFTCNISKQTDQDRVSLKRAAKEDIDSFLQKIKKMGESEAIDKEAMIAEIKSSVLAMKEKNNPFLNHMLEEK